MLYKSMLLYTIAAIHNQPAGGLKFRTADLNPALDMDIHPS